MKKIFGIFLLLALLSGFVLAQEDTNDVEVYIFYGQGCPYCSKMIEFLGGLEQKYLELKVTEYDLRENIELLLLLADKYDLELTDRIPIPIVFFNHKVFVGYNGDIANSIEGYVKECINTDCISPMEKEKGDTTQTTGDANIAEKESKLKELTVPAVISAAAVDAINPCAFAVLIVLMTTVLASGVRKKAFFSGLAFTLAIYISYFLMGLGLYSAVSATGISHVFYGIVAGLAILIGLFNLKDYFWYGKLFIMEVPRSWRPRMKMLIKGITSVPGAFFIGFVVSVFLLPCTSGPYIVILGLLAKAATKNFAIMLLLIYNLIFILPMLLITLGIYFGITTTEKAEEWRTKRLKLLHLIAGIIMLLLGIGMFVAIGLGVV